MRLYSHSGVCLNNRNEDNAINSTQETPRTCRQIVIHHATNYMNEEKIITYAASIFQERHN